MLSLPSAARAVPPLTGASRYSSPISASRSPTERAVRRIHRTGEQNNTTGRQGTRRASPPEEHVVGLFRVEHHDYQRAGSRAASAADPVAIPPAAANASTDSALMS